MSIHRRGWRIIVAAIVVLSVGIALVSASRNRLSGTTIVGHWQGYVLQPAGADGRKTATRAPLAFTFRGNGLVTRGGNGTEAHYLVCGNALVFYDIRSRTAPSHPVLCDARIVGDTLTLSVSGTGPVIELRRAQ